VSDFIAANAYFEKACAFYVPSNDTQGRLVFTTDFTFFATLPPFQLRFRDTFHGWLPWLEFEGALCYDMRLAFRRKNILNQ
jgi:hypothetical protein